MIPNSLHSTIPEKPVDTIEVFIDDFIGATNNADITHILHLSRLMLLGIHAIPPPSEVTHMEEMIHYLKRRRTKGTEHGRTRNKT